MDGMLALVGAVLRAPHEVVEAGASPARRAALVPRLLAIVALGAGIFGGVVGAWHGGVQTLYAGLKMPMLLIIPTMVCLPAVRALFSTVDEEVGWDRLALAGLVGAARSAVLAAAAGPIVWLLWSVVWDYHEATLVLALTLAGVGLPGLATIRFALPSARATAWPAVLASVALLGAATMQTGWVLRPFIARPTAQVTLFRPLEADVVQALVATTRSSAGDYGHFSAEPAGLVGKGMRREGAR